MEETPKFPAIVELNVGGRFFTTTLLTLTKCKDNMLAAMFSGNYSVLRDDNGRYFIDTDGNNFVHILNYLRYGDLPPASIAESIYKEAMYFGLHGLVDELEKYPCILGKIQRNSFRNQFPGYRECLDAIIMAAGNHACTTTSNVKILLYQKDEYLDKHTCTCLSKQGNQSFTADISLGPWPNNSSEKDVLNCLMVDLETQGFTVTSNLYGHCEHEYDQNFPCGKPFYDISFHWWKS